MPQSPDQQRGMDTLLWPYRGGAERLLLDAMPMVGRGFPASHVDSLLDAHEPRRTVPLDLIFDVSAHFPTVGR